MAEATIPESDEASSAAARLEAALERIARHAAGPLPALSAPDPRLAELAQRLDALIATLRRALAKGT